MKLKHLLVASALCITLTTAPSAFACEHRGWLSSFFHHHDETDSQNGPDKQNGRQASQDGVKRTGNNCDNGRGNGGGYCGTGSSTGGSTGGSTSGSGTGSGGGIVYK